jgi:hypothetical protein
MPWWGWVLVVIAVIVIIPLKIKVWKILLKNIVISNRSTMNRLRISRSQA